MLRVKSGFLTNNYVLKKKEVVFFEMRVKSRENHD